MTSFQQSMAATLKALLARYDTDLSFKAKGVHACAAFPWNGKEALLIVGDGELIFDFNGEHYFETPADPTHAQVRAFTSFVRLCLDGMEPREARRVADQHETQAS